jgi:predicted small lipoprotein YifL
MNVKALPVMLLMACAVAFCGCGKKQPPTPPPAEISGVKVDVPKLRQAFIGAAQELQSDMNAFTSSLRYGQYEKGLMALDKLSQNPALNEAQKKVVGEVIEQMKQVIEKAGPQR